MAQIDLDYRPTSYFWPMSLTTHLLSQSRGKRRAALERILSDHGPAEIPEILAKANLTAEERTALGSIHPAFMGGVSTCQDRSGSRGGSDRNRFHDI